MKQWQSILKKSITSPRQLEKYFSFDTDSLEQVINTYPMRINPYYLGLIKKIGDPIWRQAVPDELEMRDKIGLEDPLNEENLSPVPNLIHKYPDRVLFLVTSQCAMYCRFCTRKRKVGTDRMHISHDTIRAGLDYLRKTREIRDVLISGGDPLLLPDDRLAWILESVRKIKHIEMIRIGSRVPCTLPMRVTVRLANMLKRYHPLYINTHFNHPAEITLEATQACARLANAGIPLGCQTVLLRGVNDHPEIIKKLLHSLLKIRVRPYYIFQGDLTRGTNHFRTSIEEGLAIIQSLIGHTSGMAVPTYAIDAPGGGGKIPLVPGYIDKLVENLTFTNYRGELCSYPNATEGKM